MKNHPVTSTHPVAQIANRILTQSSQTIRALLFVFALTMGLHQQAYAQVTYALTNVWYVPTNVVSAANIIVNGDNNRSLAYDINSNQVFVAAKGGGSPAPDIQVLDGATGATLGLLEKAVVSGGTFLLNQVKVARDGAIYSANLVNPGTPASITKIYRWTNWLSPATVAFAGNAISNPATLFGLTTTPGARVGDSMAITGSGTSTMILMPVSSASPTLTTNMVLFTTTDGITFTNHIIAISGFTSVGGSGICGVSFYTNNTFFIRTSGSAGNNIFLFQFPANIVSLDAGPISATQIGSYSLPGVLSTAAFIDYESSVQGGLMALVSPQNSGGSSALAQVALYSDPVVGNTSCSLQQASTNYPHLVTNGNLAGAAALGGAGFAQYIFSLDCNNGVRCSGITTIPAQPPTISTQPVGGTVFPPYTLSVTASGFCPLIYQWQATNNAGAFTNIPGATSATYTISSPSTNFYRVVITNTINLTTSSVAQVSILTPVTNSSVSQLWRVAANQSGYAYLTTTDNTRGIAYDTNTHRVVVSSTTGLFILNGDNGTNVASLSLTGVTFGGLLGGCDQVGIADDGVVYAGNLNSGGGAFNLYRWSAPTNTVTAVSAYTGDPGSGSNDRWGDNFAVRGAGANTQILLASKGTNVALLTTTDGTNYTTSLIAITNATSGFTGNGITFSAGNTFWAKSSGGNLWQIAYDPIALTGGVLFNYTQPGQIPSSMVGVGVDTALNIVAGIILSDSPDNLQLFQLTGTADGPVLFQQSFFASNNGNGNNNAAISMKSGRIYGLDVNNGILALSYGAPAGTPPIIVTPPASQTVYTNIRVLTFTVNVSGSIPLLYQWRYNSNNISGATSSSYSITNPPLSAAGYYDVIVRNVSGMVTSSPPALLTLIIPTTSTVVTQLWTLAAGSRAYLDGSSYNTRGLAYDTNTGTLLLADHANIYLLAGTNGSDIGTLNTVGLPAGGNFLIDQLGVADDGVLYSCNLALAGQLFSIVQWTSLAPGSVGTGYAFGGATGADPSGTGDRWGDTLAVRGSGAATEILCASYSGTFVVIFDTTDGSTFTAHPINITNAPAGFSGQGIAFGSGNTFWAKSPGFNLRLINYDKTSGLGGAILTYTAGSQINSSMDGISMDVANNILGGVVFSDTPNDFQLLQLSGNTNPPALFDQAFFGSVNPNIQNNAASTLKGGLGFALDVNNGVVALSYGVPPPPAFSITSVSYQVGTGTTLTWPTFNGRTYQVEYKNSLLNTSWTPVGSPIVASGTPTLFTDSTATGTARYYHVVAQ